MMEEMGAEMQSGGSDGLSEFDAAMGELMDEVNNLESAELDVEEATNALIEQMRREREAEVGDTVNQTLDDLQTQLQELRQTYDALGQDELPQLRRETLEDLDDGLARMAGMLERRDIAAAEEQATNLISRFGDAALDLRTDEALLRHHIEARQQASQGRRFADRGQDTMIEMQRMMNGLMELAQPRPGPAQNAEMQALGERQAQVQEQLGQLQERAAEFEAQFPSGDGLGEPLEGISQSMQRAQEALRGGRPRPALQGEQSALQGLRTMRENLQQQTQQQRMRERMQRGSSSQEEVAIPEEGQRDRVRFRQEVIDAMREDHLESNDNEIRAYYESLVE